MKTGMKIGSTALAAVMALGMAIAPFADAQARPHGGRGGHGGWGHHHGGGYRSGALAAGIIGGTLLSAALLSRPSYAYYDSYYAPPPRVVYREPAYYPRETVVYEEPVYYERW